MSTHHIPFVIFSLLAVFSTAYAAEKHSSMPGGYTPIKNLNDPHVQDIAKFAIDEHNKASPKSQLKLVKIVEGESQVVAGTNYRLNLATDDGNHYVAVVFVGLKNQSKKLTSFTVVEKRLGGYTPIKNLNDPYVQEIAKFAIDEHNKMSPKSHLKLVKIVKGESQVVAGTNYRLTLATNDGNNYVAVVFVGLQNQSKKLTSFTIVEKRVGGYTPIKNLNDPYVQEIAKFAIDEHNKASPKSHLKLVKIVKGESQVVAGTNYRLTLATDDGNHYVAVVFVGLQNQSKKLTSFTVVKKILGGFKPIKNLNDPSVQEIAKFAIDEHNKASPKSHLKLVKIVKGESQIVAGTNYRLTLATDDGKRYLAAVYVGLKNQSKKLTSFTAIAV